MKIISKGKRKEDREVRSTCFDCGTVFEWSMRDGKYNSNQRDGDYYSVVCPVCGRTCTAATTLFK